MEANMNNIIFSARVALIGLLCIFIAINIQTCRLKMKQAYMQCRIKCSDNCMLTTKTLKATEHEECMSKCPCDLFYRLTN